MKNSFEVYSWVVNKPGNHHTLVGKGTFMFLHHNELKIKNKATRQCREVTSIKFSDKGKWEQDWGTLFPTWKKTIKKGKYKGYVLKLTRHLPVPFNNSWKYIDPPYIGKTKIKALPNWKEVTPCHTS